jgi:hypothetical protein
MERETAAKEENMVFINTRTETCMLELVES